MVYQNAPAVQLKKLYRMFDSIVFYFDVLDLSDLLESTNVASANLHWLMCSFLDSKNLVQRSQRLSLTVLGDQILSLLVVHTDYIAVD